MLEDLVCPLCLGSLKKALINLACQKCGQVYQAKNGIFLLWQPEWEKETRRQISQDLAFSKKYVEAIIKGEHQNLLAEEKEFFERERGGSLAARLVDRKALNTLGELNKIDFRGLRALDIGAGGGKEAIWLFAQGVREVVCLDISREFLTLAKKRLEGKPASFIVAHAEKLPFADDTFDLAFFMGSLHHIGNPQRALAEAGRVAKRVVLVGEPTSLKFLDKILDLAHWNTEYGGMKTTRLFSHEVTQTLENLGFRVRTKTNFIWFPFSLFGRWKNNHHFLKLYFGFLSFLDQFFSYFGHNLTAFAQRK